jgi:hypothetical protein
MRLAIQLRDDRLLLGDLSAPSADGLDHLPVARLDQQRRQAFRARFAQVAGLTLLETAVHRRLAVADLVVALCLGHGAPPRPFHPAPRGDTCRPLATAKFRTILRICENSQLTNYYGNNDRLMPNGDPRIFELPCRFPCRVFDSAGESRARF